jgi:3-hydroxyisobutyrate dehydrogenase-like beta-hydroxyacid dehydrogenase
MAVRDPVGWSLWRRRNIFAAPLGYKDIRLALAAAESLRVPMPLGSLLHDRFLRLLARGGDHLDWAAIGGLAAQDAGGDPA